MAQIQRHIWHDSGEKSEARHVLGGVVAAHGGVDCHDLARASTGRPVQQLFQLGAPKRSGASSSSTAAAALSATWSSNGEAAMWTPSGMPCCDPAGTTETGTPAIECAITLTQGRYDSSGSSPGSGR